MGNNRATVVNVSPSIGVFYKTNRLAGGFLTYGYYDDGTPAINIARTYGGGIFFRQYKPTLKNLYVFFDERAFYNYQYSTLGAGHSHLSIVGISIQPGLAYDLTKNMQAELFLNNFLNAGYSTGNGIDTYYVSSSLESNLLNNVSLGFRFYLK